MTLMEEEVMVDPQGNDVTTVPTAAILDARGVRIHIGARVMAAVRHSDQADLIYGSVTGFSKDGNRVAVLPINRSIGDRAVWSTQSGTRTSSVIADRVMVVSDMPRSTVPTHQERIAEAKRNAEERKQTMGLTTYDR